MNDEENKKASEELRKQIAMFAIQNELQAIWLKTTVDVAARATGLKHELKERRNEYIAIKNRIEVNEMKLDEKVLRGMTDSIDAIVKKLGNAL